jgi:hypothetical protein
MTWRESQIKKYNALASLTFFSGLIALLIVSFLTSTRINADIMPYDEALKLRLIYTSIATLPFFILAAAFESVSEKYKTKL